MNVADGVDGMEVSPFYVITTTVLTAFYQTSNMAS